MKRPQRSTSRVRDGEVQKKVLTCMPDGPARWDEMGRRPPNGRKVGEHSEAQKEAWKEVRTRTLECGRCGGLIDWRAAKKAARQTRRGRQHGQMRTHDGCRRCSKAKSNAESRLDAQEKMANEMRKGKRKLVAWPESLADTTAWERPKETKAKLIRRALMKVVKLRRTH